MKAIETTIDVDAAWARFEQRAKGLDPAGVWKNQALGGEESGSPIVLLNKTIELPMKQPRTERLKRWRPILAAGLVAGLTVALLTTDWGDKAMAAMLQKFRVQHLTGVAIGEQDFDKLRQALQQSGLGEQELNLDKFGTVTTVSGGKPQKLSPAEAGSVIGAAVKLLPGVSAEQSEPVMLIPQTQFTLKLHVDEVNRVLKRLGGKTLFPASADNEPVVGTLPESVQVTAHTEKLQRTLIQMKQPQLDVPSGIDVDQVRKAVLDLPFLPEDARRKLEGAIDWRQTLFVPMNGETTKTTTVAGREVIYSAAAQRKTAIWLDGDRVYHLSGSYDSAEALLRDVKEIIGS